MADEPDDEPFEQADEEFEPRAASAVDRKSQKRIRDRAKREAEEERQFVRGILASPIGRRWLWKVIDWYNPYEPRFATDAHNSVNDMPTWAIAGKRDAGLKILRDLERQDFAGVCLMRKECDPHLAEPPKLRRRRGE